MSLEVKGILDFVLNDVGGKRAGKRKTPTGTAMGPLFARCTKESNADVALLSDANDAERLTREEHTSGPA